MSGIFYLYRKSCMSNTGMKQKIGTVMPFQSILGYKFVITNKYTLFKILFMK